jgi:hypothetical protein
MKTSRIKGAASLAALALLAAAMAAPVYAASSQGDSSSAATPWLNMNGQAWVNFTGSVPVLTATFTNLSPGQTNATAFATIHNVLGQTVAIETFAFVGMTQGQNMTALFPIQLPLDAYSVDLFVLSSSGTAISQTTNSTLVA